MRDVVARYRRAKGFVVELALSHRGETRTLRVRTVGMMQWDVEIREGTLDRYPVDIFTDEIHSAFGALMADRQNKIIMVKADHFDIGIPRRWLDLMNEARAINRRA